MWNELTKGGPRRHRVGAAFLGGQAVSLLGSGLVQFAIIWYVTMRANSGTSMMIITLASFLPQLVVAPFAGVWADRYDRRWLTILSDGSIALVTLALMIAFIAGYESIWMIYVVAAIRSFGGGIQSPAISALIPQITPKSDLVRVNGVYNTINNVLLLLSPMLGGAMLTLFPMWTVFLVDVVTAAVAIVILMFLPIPDFNTGVVRNGFGREKTLKPGQVWGFPTKEEYEAAEAEKGLDESTETGGRQFKKGLVYVRGNRLVRNLMATYAVFMMLLAPVAILTPLYIRRHFGIEPWRITATQTALFAGMAVGGVFVSIKGRFKSHLTTIRTSGFIVAGLTMGLAFLGIFESSTFTLFAFLAFCLGTVVPFYTTAVTTLFQEKVEAQYHGRVFAILFMIGSAAIPLGTVIFGPLADIFPIENLLAVTSGLQLLLLAFSWKTLPRRYED